MLFSVFIVNMWSSVYILNFWIFIWFACQLLDWHLHLDRSLPAPLSVVGVWLHEAEEALREEIIIQQAHDVTADTVRRALEQHKVSMQCYAEDANHLYRVCKSVRAERCWIEAAACKIHSLWAAAEAVKVLAFRSSIFRPENILWGVCSSQVYAVCINTLQDVLKRLESHQQVLQRIHKDRSVDGVPVPLDQLQDIAER